MPKGPKGEKRPADVIGTAVKVAKIAKIATGEIAETKTEKSDQIKSGKARGCARAEQLSAENRRKVTKKAAPPQWKYQS